VTALLAAAGFAALAAAIHWAARRADRRWPAPGRGVFGPGWVLGFLLRLGGVAVLALAAGLRPDLFPPLPAAVGYLGVLVPLLGLELRTGR
jgi:hypothetical protein